MKKTLIIASAMLFTVSGAQAQFLSKLIDKATDKAINKVTGKSSSSTENVDPIFLDPYYGQSTNSSRELYYVEGNVAPAAANDVNSLLAKLPSIPAGSEFLNPTKSGMTSYLRSLQAVSERASQLGEQEMNANMAQREQQMKAAQQQAAARQQQYDDNMNIVERLNSVPDKDKVRLMELGEKLDGMSDKQAEAYLKAHPDDMKLIQKYGNLFADLANRKPAQTVDMSAYMPQRGQVVEDKAADIIRGALKLEDFVKRESEKLSAEFNRLQEEDRSTDELSAQVKNFELRTAYAWNKYLNGIVAQVKQELLAFNANTDMPENFRHAQIYENISKFCEYLWEAYEGDFLMELPPLCQRDVVRQLKLAPEEYLVRPEFFLYPMKEFEIYKRNYETGNLFRFNNGKWNRMPDNFELGYENNAPMAENRLVSGTSGQAVFSGTAGFIRLPEGGVAYPVAAEVSGNTIRWTEFVKVEEETPGETVTWQIVECTRQL